MPKTPSSISERSPLAGVDQLFKKTSNAPLLPPPATVKATPEPAKNVKPKEPKERELVQTSVRLYTDQLTWLENLIYKAKRTGSSSVVSNSALFRTFVEICRERNLSLRGVDSDEELKTKLKKAFNLN